MSFTFEFPHSRHKHKVKIIMKLGHPLKGRIFMPFSTEEQTIRYWNN